MPHGSLGHVNLSMNQGIKVQRILLNLDPTFEPNHVRMNLLMNTIRKSPEIPVLFKTKLQEYRGRKTTRTVSW